MDAVEVVRLRRVRRGLLELPALLEALDVVAPLLHVGLDVVVAAALEVEVGDAEEVAVIRERHGGHFEVDGTLDQGLDGRRAVEDRKVRVVVQVNERHVRTSVVRKVFR